jgi:putative N6-adenine-specific DNA methylase
VDTLMKVESFFAPCPRGLEPALVEEIEALGGLDIQSVPGGVGFQGPYSLCYAVNLESRIASRVLWRLAQAPYRNEDDIYRAVRVLKWHDWFAPHRSLRVDVSAIRSPLKSLDFITLRVKDAVCDVFREAAGSRPNVDTRNPDVRVYVFLSTGHCTLYLDTSGEALFKRGYRSATAAAPLRENLAAGILRMIGWEPGTPLLDPMCGSGTFLTEAAMIESGMAPGAYRRFGFEKLTMHDASNWHQMRDAARRPRLRADDVRIYGSDHSLKAVRSTRANLVALGLEGRVRLEQANVLKVAAPAPSGVVVMNPPYGVRMEELRQLAEFYPRLGDALKNGFAGWTAYVLTADLRLARLIRLSASRRTPLFNGALDCRLFEYKLVAGSNRERPRQARMVPSDD